MGLGKVGSNHSNLLALRYMAGTEGQNEAL